MTRVPKLASRREDGASGSGGVARGLSRRATLRPEIRAAMALEEAGELQEAARVFEYAGEHAQAAALRLEHAATLRDPRERLDILREGCARNHGDTLEGRTLHLALADALLRGAEVTGDAASRRSLELEAARALEEAEEGGRAGELYEALGLLHKAAAAYERSGEISRLELVLEVLERLDERQAARRALIREVDDAVAQGQRRYAHELLREHTHARRSEIAHGTPAPAGLVSRLQLLESKLLRRDRVDLRWGTERVTAIRGAPRMRIGRAPDAELPLPGALLSRHHVELSVETRGDHPRLVATDLGSKVGSFWEGEPMLAGEPMIIDGPGELGLGTATAIEVHPVTADHGALGGLVRPVGTQRWTLFLPAGGPLWLAPDIRVPATILFDRGYVVLDLAGRVAAYLGDAPLSPGSCMELMVGDRVRLAAAPLTLEVLA